MHEEYAIEPVLVASELSFSYPDRPDVLSKFNIEINPGEKVGLVGPNGSGKTTFFLLVCGVLKPAEGDILLFNNTVRSGEFCPDVGLVFQNSDDQLFSPSVWEDVAFGPQNMGLSAEEIEKRVKTALEATGCIALSERPVHHLSQGEKRMVAIAGVLSMHPRLLIYDEPSANLDIRSRRRLIKMLQESEHATLVASHDLEMVLEICHRVVLIDQGNIVADGKPDDIFSNEELMEAHGQERPHSLIPHKLPHDQPHAKHAG
ncbi:energy-coupling factor ABC transporter ATP-binding protein [Chloroflexota bacterium]